MPSEASFSDVDWTEDLFLDGRLKLRQPKASYRAGLDAVLLAAAVTAEDGDRVLDAGSGVGAVGLCIAARLRGVRVSLVEIDPDLSRRAKVNIELNGLGDRVELMTADLTGSREALAASGLTPNSFDHIVSNPPYLSAGRHRTPAHPVTARAFEMPEGGLEQWARFWAHMAIADGTLTIIHRADALKLVLDALEGRFGAIQIAPLHPSPRRPAGRIIVRGRKGSRAPLELLPGIVLHETMDRFTPRVEAVVRHAAALDLDPPRDTGK